MPTLSFRVDEETKERLERLAARGHSTSQIFRSALEEKMDTLEGKEPTRTGLGLTLKERIALAYQFDLLAIAKPDDKRFFEEQGEALREGYELEYSAVAQGFEAGLSRPECSEVLDIMDMYMDLIRSSEELGKDADTPASDLAFPGFDGNYETAWMGYARFLVERQGRYEVVGRSLGRTGFNSHFPALPMYRAMLRAYRKVRTPGDTLPVDAIRTVLAAGRRG